MTALIRISATIFFTIWAIGSAGETTTCSDQNLYDYVNGACIYVHHELAVGGNVKYAEAGCQGLSWEYPHFNDTWRLPLLYSKEKSDALMGVLKKATAKFGGNKVWFWIGLRREDDQPVDATTWKDKSKWLWTFDNSTLEDDSYMQWANLNGQNEAPKETCVLARFLTFTDGTEMKWYDFECSGKHANLLVCESIPEIPTTTTSTSTSTSTTTTTSTTTSTTSSTSTVITTMTSSIASPTTKSTMSTATEPTMTKPVPPVDDTAPPIPEPTSLTSPPSSVTSTKKTPTQSSTSGNGSVAAKQEPPTSDAESGSSPGMWIGIGIGLAALIIGVVIGVVLYLRRRRRKERVNYTTNTMMSMFSARSEDSGRYENVKPYKKMSPASKAKKEKQRRRNRRSVSDRSDSTRSLSTRTA